ncbi:hypothetical protein BDV41DRAFT_555684 [Aspergillus transmontanensis]|uniref:Uncharacterized protein n=1 Tax=Aspergillus transmontanensis TaxID=1034304 RepID=A0A5N6VG66_9EURO|nr:hypothetical protein BDV41DRAFT_555684 [Aspergillus transmontanensis]
MLRSTPLSTNKYVSNEAFATKSRRWLENLAIVCTCLCFRWLIFLFFPFSLNRKMEIRDSIMRKT